MKNQFSFLNNRGFTLVELLVVLAIFITVGGLILSVLFISLRGSTKTQVETMVKQNGSYALSQIVRTVRYAGSLDTPTSCVPSATVQSIAVRSLADSEQTVFSCPAAPGEGISSNSASLVDTNSLTVTNCSFTCKQEASNQAPQITIEFTLSAKNTGGLLEASSTIPFQSTVIMRNVMQGN